MECPLFQLPLQSLDLPLYQFQHNVHSHQIHQSPVKGDVRKTLRKSVFNLRSKINCEIYGTKYSFIYPY